MDNTKIIKMVENALVIIILFIVIIVLFPSIKKMAEITRKQAVESSVQGVFDMTKDYFTSINMYENVNLPFKIIYNKDVKDGYTIYSANKKYENMNKIDIEIEGMLPESGSVEIKSDGEIEAKDLKFGEYTCNKKTTSSPTICIKSEW